MALELKHLDDEIVGRTRVALWSLNVTNTGAAPTAYVPGGIAITPKQVGLSLIYGVDIRLVINLNGTPKTNIPASVWDPIRGVLQLFDSGAANAPLTERGATPINGILVVLAFLGI